MAITTTARKTGRPQKHFVDRNGNTIVGFSRRPSDGRWRIIATGDCFTEPDEALAVARFREWELRQVGSNLGQLKVHPNAQAALLDVLRRTVEAGGSLSATVEPAADGHTWAVTDDHLSSAQWLWLKRTVLERPRWVSERLGIEQIGYLADLPKPSRSPTLEEVGKLYIDKAKISPNWRQKSERFWRAFCESVEVRTVREVTQEKVTEFYDEIIDRVGDPGEGKSATWAKHRFGQIKSVLQFARKRGKWSDDVSRLLNYCAVLVPPTAVTLDPRPISRADWQKMYAAADENLKPILVTAINCCMYGQEVADIRWDDLDLDAGTLVMRRGKTNVVRVATLWPETVAQLRAIPRRADYVFITKYHRQQHTSKTIGKEWRKLKTQVGVAKGVQFCHLRDGSFTAAVSSPNVQFQHAQALAGHRTGQSDHYVLRRPQDVAAACQAVYATYFRYSGSP